ncbi:MAG: hypothetical protein K1X65_05435 [Caldilineales bacterium]|nr:hypothetical protein [Caldilineales bacterium]MCW5858552.1 hypothetical protein [Caldilineales bacterium]
MSASSLGFWGVLGRLRHLFSSRDWLTTPDHRPRPRASVFIRHVDAGSCNDGNVELAALWNPQYDAERYGLKLVASPRHADVLVVTGPLVRSMEQALLSALRAMPEPRCVVTIGDDCDEPHAIYRNSYAIVGLPEEILQARGDDHIPGNPPTPQAILEHLLTMPTV